MNTFEYEQLVSQYADSVYRLALSSCKNPADAEDIVQNTFLKLWLRSEGFADGEHARRWLLRVAVNECRSLWRAPWKRHRPLDELEDKAVFSAPEESGLREALRKLPRSYAQALYLYYYEDMSVRETAALMSLSETAVQTRLLRARQKLKELLKEEWQ